MLNSNARTMELCDLACTLIYFFSGYFHLDWCHCAHHMDVEVESELLLGKRFQVKYILNFGSNIWQLNFGAFVFSQAVFCVSKFWENKNSIEHGPKQANPNKLRFLFFVNCQLSIYCCICISKVKSLLFININSYS